MNCQVCGKRAYSEYCVQHKPRKPIPKIGKQTKKWFHTKDKWLEVNKSPYYFCYICGKMMTRSQLTLDHVKSRSSHPELRNSWKNLQPCCWECNSLKGSRSLEDFLIERGNDG